jgi:hypothetical protein
MVTRTVPLHAVSEVHSLCTEICNLRRLFIHYKNAAQKVECEQSSFVDPQSANGQIVMSIKFCMKFSVKMHYMPVPVPFQNGSHRGLVDWPLNLFVKSVDHTSTP